MKIMLLYLKIFSIMFFFFVFLEGKTQDIERVKRTLDTLCSKQFYGRGYLNEGDKKAAAWLAKRFEQLGLRAFGKDYYQPFSLTVNTLPKVSLSFKGHHLRLGRDFIADAASASYKGSLKAYILDTTLFDNAAKKKYFLEKDLKKYIIFYPQKYEQIISKHPDVVQKIQSAGAIGVRSERLVHTIADYTLPIPKVILAHHIPIQQNERVKLHLENKLIANYQTNNVIGYFEGTTQKDSILVFSAHYDHLGGMDSVFFAGGNDNASGVAMLLELAAYYQQYPPKFSIVFMLFAAEEAGLLGSAYHVKHPFFPLSQIKFLINLDLFATGEAGMMVVNGSVHYQAFELISRLNEEKKYLPIIKKRGKAANSDHYYFSEKGVPSFFFYLMGDWAYYHHPDDRPPLPLNKFVESFSLIRDFAEELQK